MLSSPSSSEVRSRWPFRSIPLRVALLLSLVLSVAGGVGGVAHLSWRAGRHLALRLTEQLRREATHQHRRAPRQIFANSPSDQRPQSRGS
jgi:hypothetical protein